MYSSGTTDCTRAYGRAYRCPDALPSLQSNPQSSVVFGLAGRGENISITTEGMPSQDAGVLLDGEPNKYRIHMMFISTGICPYLFELG
jgi:hypothetical protein